jgi:uncharacterized LabA/DUF88 family protein
MKRVLPSAHLTTFDYAGFAAAIAGGTPGRVSYYVGEVKKYPGNEKSAALYAHQQSLLLHLRRSRVEVKLGYLLRADGTFHEKGVDVQIAVDMVRGAIKGEYETFYLISSDTDLLPAIATARDEGKRVIYVAFAQMVSRALAAHCSRTLVLSPGQLEPFLPAA